MTIQPFTIAEPTAQQIFDHAVRGVVRQGTYSLSINETCAYRGKNDTACGIGHLVEDATAALWDGLSNSSIRYILELDNRIDGVLPWMGEHASLLCAIQNAHDDAKRDSPERFMRDFLRDCMDIARNCKLEIPAEARTRLTELELAEAEGWEEEDE